MNIIISLRRFVTTYKCCIAIQKVDKTQKVGSNSANTGRSDINRRSSAFAGRHLNNKTTNNAASTYYSCNGSIPVIHSTIAVSIFVCPLQVMLYRERPAFIHSVCICFSVSTTIIIGHMHLYATILECLFILLYFISKLT